MGSISEYKLATQSIDADLFLGTDNLQLVDDLSLTAFVGISSYKNENESINISGSDFIVPGLVSYANTKNKNASYGFSEKQINSAYGSAEIGYKDYAFLSLTARNDWFSTCLLYTSPSPRDRTRSRMPSSA